MDEKSGMEAQGGDGEKSTPVSKNPQHSGNVEPPPKDVKNDLPPDQRK